MKNAIQAKNISHVIMNTQRYRQISDDRNFIIIAESHNDPDRNIELHLTEGEAHKLRLDLIDFLEDRPTITRIVSYD